MATEKIRVKIGEVGVDAGMIMVGDPCYFVGSDTTINERCGSWSQACDEVFCKQDVDLDKGVNVYGLGVAVATTDGDGRYPVYLETDYAGRRRLVVDLE